jgi:hypothetical protein
LAVARIRIVTRLEPHENRILPPARTAATTAEEVQLRAVPRPITRVEAAASTAANGAGETPRRGRDIERLAPVTRQILGVASVAGRRVGHRLLAAVAGSSEAELDGALREAVAWNVLVTDADGASYAFRHALLREAVYHDLLAGERLRTHAALARALADRPELAGDGVGVAAELAHHWLAAGELGSAFSASVRAGSDAANAHAPAEALRQFERSLDLWDRVGHAAESASLDRAELLQRAAEAALAAGRDERAVELGRLAIAQADAELDPKRASFLTTRLGRYLWSAGDGDAALIAYHEALSFVRSGTPPAERARALAGEGQASCCWAASGVLVAGCLQQPVRHEVGEVVLPSCARQCDRAERIRGVRSCARGRPSTDSMRASSRRWCEDGRGRPRRPTRRQRVLSSRGPGG